MQKSLLRSTRIGFECTLPEECICLHQGSFAGPTVLEVFNTLLKHLRLSVEFEARDLQGESISSANLNTSSKDSDEKIVQNAVIQTIGAYISLLKLFWKTAIQKALTEGTCLLRDISQR